MTEPLMREPRDVWSDAEVLVPLLRTNDEAAWTMFVTATIDIFHRYVAALTGRVGDVADDVVQETYVAILLKIGNLEQPRAFQAWAFRVLHNATLDVFRRRGLLVVGLADDDLPVHRDGADPGARYDAVELLSRLPLALRSTILLVDGYGFSYREAAEILAIEIGTVGSRLNLARARLRRAMGAAT
jgi:RNA polymerase sigma-70 factor, ECF subfamily